MDSAMKCAEEVGGEACLSAEEAVNDADIICTVTLSPTPILKKAWVKEGCHINGSPPYLRLLCNDLISSTFKIFFCYNIQFQVVWHVLRPCLPQFLLYVHLLYSDSCWSIQSRQV